MHDIVQCVNSSTSVEKIRRVLCRILFQNRETNHDCADYSSIMLKIAMCAAGQKFPTHSLDACMEAGQSEATTYYGYDKNITLSKQGQKFPTHGLDRHTERASSFLAKRRK